MPQSRTTSSEHFSSVPLRREYTFHAACCDGISSVVHLVVKREVLFSTGASPCADAMRRDGFRGRCRVCDGPLGLNEQSARMSMENRNHRKWKAISSWKTCISASGINNVKLGKTSLFPLHCSFLRPLTTSSTRATFTRNCTIWAITVTKCIVHNKAGNMIRHG